MGWRMVKMDPRFLEALVMEGTEHRITKDGVEMTLRQPKEGTVKVTRGVPTDAELTSVMLENNGYGSNPVVYLIFEHPDWPEETPMPVIDVWHEWHAPAAEKGERHA